VDQYRNRYPLQGDVAVICEGDLVGYEVDLLEKWSASLDCLVDVWPCGTKTAIFGFSDAIGRSVPILVIEDRDYRQSDIAENECRGKCKDRRGRQVRVSMWQTWNRHEIENYLLEPSISLPVVAEAFQVSEDDARDRLSLVISSLATDQAAQWTIHQVRALLPQEGIVGGLPRKTSRPLWNPKECKVEAADVDVVAEKLAELTQTVVSKIETARGGISPEGVVEAFRAKRDEWGSVSLADPDWRIDWAGKEILQTLCRWLAGEFGWKSAGEETRERVDWLALMDERRDGVKDREIAIALQPRLVDSLLSHLTARNDDIVREWTELREAIKEAADFELSE
jgi:hypothetical protein